MGWHQFGWVEKEEEESEDEEMDEKDEDDEEEEDDDIPDLGEIISNNGLSEAFHKLAKDLDVLDPKDPETDIFKEQLLENGINY